MHKQFPDISLPRVRGKLRSYRLARNLDDTSIPRTHILAPEQAARGMECYRGGMGTWYCPVVSAGPSAEKMVQG